MNIITSGNIYGWTGKILRINLTTREIMVETLAKGAMELVGGTGLALHYLLEEQLDYDALGSQSMIVIVTGPCQGTSLPICGRHVVVSKSPLTGYFIDSHAGGFIGPELKKMGGNGEI
jgi:aldehyde:ferredoxin oxidoreductase